MQGAKLYPSLQATTNRNQSSSSIKREISLARKKGDHEIKVFNLKKENSDFRISKKNSVEVESSQRRLVDASSSNERRNMTKHIQQPSQPNLISLNFLETKQLSMVSGITTGKKLFPSDLKLNTNEASITNPGKGLIRNVSTKNLQSLSKSNPRSPAPDLSKVGGIKNFKVDIDRLLKASGIIDSYNKQEILSGVMNFTNRGSLPGGNTFNSTASNIKH